MRRCLREVRGPKPRGDQRWSTFIRNHAHATLAMDFAVDYFPSLAGKLRCVWILAVLEIGSRRLVHIDATEHPTREWIAQQLREATRNDNPYRYLVLNRTPCSGCTLAISRSLRSLRACPGRLGASTGRTSSITNAFVNAIILVIPPSDADVVEALAILGLSLDDIRCVYCGDASTEWDHLRPLVNDQQPTGYVSEIANSDWKSASSSREKLRICLEFGRRCMRTENYCAVL